jgi:hypothetical protein
MKYFLILLLNLIKNYSNLERTILKSPIKISSLPPTKKLTKIPIKIKNSPNYLPLKKYKNYFTLLITLFLGIIFNGGGGGDF